MALGHAHAVALLGISGQLVEIEADVARGLPGVQLVGLPDTALSEARARVRAAAANSGVRWPDAKLTFALSPASLHKTGSAFDLALVVALIDAMGQAKPDRVATTVFVGELALDGRLRRVRGVLPAAMAAAEAGYRRIVVPEASLPEAALVPDIEVLGALHLRDVLDWLRDEGELTRQQRLDAPRLADVPDMADVLGQSEARFALEVAAAGGHHLLLTGPPGVGKTMLAQRLPGILPPLSAREALEVTAIHSVAGLLPADRPLVELPPFVAPHYTATPTALIGGGSGLAKPGAVSHAHRGVLFIDEAPEMGNKALEALRTPLEEGEIRVARRDGITHFPARFQLVLAANPCPCAPAREVDCTCTPRERRTYLGKLSGPLLDRVELRVRLANVPAGTLLGEQGEPSEAVRARVTAAREAACERWSGEGWSKNADVPGPALRQRFRLSPAVPTPLEKALQRGLITARGADRALRVAWTLADLAGTTSPTIEHVAQALAFRERRIQ